jgi:hypothetical protein
LDKGKGLHAIINEHILDISKMIKIKNILGPIARCRQAPTEKLKGVQDLLATMREDGANPLLHPLLVMESGTSGKYNVVDGDTRLFIYKKWFAGEVLETPCIVLNKDLPKEIVIVIQDKANKETQSTRRDSLADEVVKMQQASSLFKTQKLAVRYIIDNKILDRPGKAALSGGHLEVRCLLLCSCTSLCFEFSISIFRFFDFSYC